jgi:hypothetical protein
MQWYECLGMVCGIYHFVDVIAPCMGVHFIYLLPSWSSCSLETKLYQYIYYIFK